jgi:APA family basic amino acid/polyamine antiporter
MPIGILGSLLICTLLYILTSAVLVGIVPYAQLDTPAPIALAVNAMGIPWFAILVKIGAIAGISSVMLVLLYGQTRIFYTMSRDGLLPPVFSVVHSKFRTPWIDTLIVGFVASCFAGFMPLDSLAKLTSMGSLTAFAVVCITVLYLRVSAPGIKRPFRAPLFPLVPLAGASMCLLLVMSLMAHEATREFFLIYLAGGMVVYFAYGIRHSRLARGDVVIGAEPTMDLPKRLEDCERRACPVRWPPYGSRRILFIHTVFGSFCGLRRTPLHQQPELPAGRLTPCGARRPCRRAGLPRDCHHR